MGLSLSYMLNSTDCQPLWNGEVTKNLIATVYHYLNPIQRTLMRTVCLFDERVLAQGLFTAIMGENPTANLSLFEQELDMLAQLALVQQGENGQGQLSYSLHPLFRAYVFEHYLEGSGLHPDRQGVTSLGVTGSLAPLTNSAEAREVALAAGHMRVATYYQHVAK